MTTPTHHDIPAEFIDRVYANAAARGTPFDCDACALAEAVRQWAQRPIPVCGYCRQPRGALHIGHHYVEAK